MKFVNQNSVKLIAIIAMTINHIGHITHINNPIWEFIYLMMGKITFPIMAYFLVEGNKYTSNWLLYLMRLFVLMMISVLPFHFTLDMQHDKPYIFNNIFFVLFVGLLMIRLLDYIYLLKSNMSKKILIFLLVTVSIVITVKSDWGIFGIYLIYLIYTRNDFIKSIITLGLIITIINCIFNTWYVAFSNIGFIIPIFIIKYYRYDMAKKNKVLQYVFYLYYPVHLIVLDLIF